MAPIIRVVIDTNIVLSALVFSGGKVGVFRQLWQNNQFMPIVSKVTITELIRVLAYPKFKLTPTDREDLLADYLPFCETIQTPIDLPEIPPCRDPLDEPFLHLAIFGKADYLVTGDRDLLILADTFPCSIVTAEQFLDILSID
jgi:uncharacterized protein